MIEAPVPDGHDMPHLHSRLFEYSHQVFAMVHLAIANAMAVKYKLSV
jgi:hypothetical protein